MSECTNGELRDLLPELMHGRLEAGVRADVLAHVSSCTECADELALLESLNVVLSRGPAIDVGAIVAAVNAQVVAPSTPTPQRTAGAWKIAIAAAALLAASGVGYGIALRGHVGATPTVASHDTPAPALVPHDTPSIVPTPKVATPRGSQPLTPIAPQQLVVVAPRHPSTGTAPNAAAEAPGMLGNLSDLSDDDVRSLGASLDGLSAVPDSEAAPLIDPLGATYDDISAGGQ